MDFPCPDCDNTATCKKLQKWTYLILGNFGVLNMKMMLKIENWPLVSKVWKGPHAKELPFGRWVEHLALRWHVTAFPLSFSIPHDEVTLPWTVHSLSLDGWRSLCRCLAVVLPVLHVHCFQWDEPFFQPLFQMGYKCSVSVWTVGITSVI